MDENQKLQEPRQEQQSQQAEIATQSTATSNTEMTQNTGPANSRPSTFEPIGSSELENVNSGKQKVDIALLVFLVMTFWLALLSVAIIFAITGDESGLSWMIALFFIWPMLLVSLIASLINIRRVESIGQKLGKTVKMAGIVIAIMFAVFSIFGLAGRLAEDYGKRKAEELNQQQY